MCCLRYENDLYTSGEVKKKDTLWCRQNCPKIPRVGQEVMTGEGTGCIAYVNTQKKNSPRADGAEIRDCAWEELAVKEDE